MLYLCPETLLPKENTGAVLEGRRLSERPSGECVGPALTHPVLCDLEKGNPASGRLDADVYRGIA